MGGGAEMGGHGLSRDTEGNTEGSSSAGISSSRRSRRSRSHQGRRE